MAVRERRVPDIIAELAWRGLLSQTTDDRHLPQWLGEKPRTLYAGRHPGFRLLDREHLAFASITAPTRQPTRVHQFFKRLDPAFGPPGRARA